MDITTLLIKMAPQYGLSGLLVIMLFYVFKELTRLTDDFKRVIQESTKTLAKLNESLDSMNTKIDKVEDKVDRTNIAVNRIIDKIDVKRT